jgi:hypothetical protein
VVFEFVFEDDRITQIDLLADPETVDRIALEPMIKRGPREFSN